MHIPQSVRVLSGVSHTSAALLQCDVGGRARRVPAQQTAYVGMGPVILESRRAAQTALSSLDRCVHHHVLSGSAGDDRCRGLPHNMHACWPHAALTSHSTAFH